MLKRTDDAKERHVLLRQLRQIIAETDAIIQQSQKGCEYARKASIVVINAIHAIWKKWLSKRGRATQPAQKLIAAAPPVSPVSSVRYDDNPFWSHGRLSEPTVV
jgi:hypothetical protein